MIDKIKKNNPIAPFVARYTGGLAPSGNGFFLGYICPFCQKKRAFWVSDHLQVCGCFNPGCKAFCDKRKDPQSKPLDIINFYALIMDITNEEAIQRLNSGATNA